MPSFNPFRTIRGKAGSANRQVDEIRCRRDIMKNSSEDDLRNLVTRIRSKSIPAAGDDLLDLFAAVCILSERTLQKSPHDVQILAGLAMTHGTVAEMGTGEGKTLSAVFPAAAHAMAGKGVHVVTVNDYLVRRDAELMAPLYNALGLSIGIIVSDMEDADRRDAYLCDVTYITNSEAGFDFLRDNLRFDATQRAQREPFFAIVDEVDSILIDEARTPLVISGEAAARPDLCLIANDVVSRLEMNEHYSVNLKERYVMLTDAGIDRVEAILRGTGRLKEGDNLFLVSNAPLVDHITQALKAKALFRRDQDYVVVNGKIVIVDQNTGRALYGRRFGDGIHQAIEAAENVEILPDNETLSSISYQNLFRRYPTLSGMTGTAETEREEFATIYGLDVVVVPPHRPRKRIDETDEIHLSENSKIRSIVETVLEANSIGQPVLLGTPSVEKSERIAQALRAAGLRRITDTNDAGGGFRVLNAVNHEMEAHIVAEAGRFGAITIATNMAGRGTDIQLGGNADERIGHELANMEPGDEKSAAEARIAKEVEIERELVHEAGGLLVIGMERNRSRRIDNQLRGRSGRQGDPGRSVFFISLEDETIAAFFSEKLRRLLSKLGIKDGDVITHPRISKAIERAQKKMEAADFDVRKELIKYDDVVNGQRKAMLEIRKELTDGRLTSEILHDMIAETCETIVNRHVPEHAYPEQWDTEGLTLALRTHLAVDVPVAQWAGEDGIGPKELKKKVVKNVLLIRRKLFEMFPPEINDHVEKTILLTSLDKGWREHLAALEHLRAVVGFRGYAQRDPLIEYRTDSHEMFERMMNEISSDAAASALRVRPTRPQTAA
ncbi:preprotein translocase subunit SecA [Roseibium sp. RKSG952]|uniref:preprotein translocase subunit SecA n=1 Tax=Roseibium sp. RKSG952 TaxID=2529384 RepID=UPI0012BCBF3D|nr:preprotein translocase subunit SecA [Roseibium sp. RKSG952]MTH96132.1 preprotein translocase subunit SecA [Roseibium sp. RKSG952]